MTDRYFVGFGECEWDKYKTTMTIMVDNEVILEHTDYGEPEDNSFYRDWDWVGPELERAYRLGFEHGKADA